MYSSREAILPHRLASPNHPFGHTAAIQPRRRKTTRILIGAKQSLFKDGLRSYIQKYADLRVVGDTRDAQTAVELIQRMSPEVFLLDMTLQKPDSFEVLATIANAKLKVATILLYDELSTNQTVLALRSGVRGIVSKHERCAVLIDAIRRVAAGEFRMEHEKLINLLQTVGDRDATSEAPRREYGLTFREREILAAVVDGYSNPDIASKLGLSAQTVKHHLSRIFDKLGVFNRVELALFAVNHDLLGHYQNQ